MRASPARLRTSEAGWIERAGVGDLAEELAKDGNAEVVGGDAPVEARAGRAAFGSTAPEDPGGEDAVEEGLDEGGAEEVLALFAFELDAERFLESVFDGVEAGEGMVFGAGAGFASVGGEKPGYVFGLDKRRAVEHDAGEEVWEEVVVAGELGSGCVPEFGCGERRGCSFPRTSTVLAGVEPERRNWRRLVMRTSPYWRDSGGSAAPRREHRGCSRQA